MVRALISGVIAFGSAYFIPVTSQIILALARSIPTAIAMNGIDAGIVRFGLASALWLLLYLLFGVGRK